MKKFLLLLILYSCFDGYSQCPQAYNGAGVASSSPYWVNCTGGAYTLNFSSPSSIGSYTLVWGDGTANTTGASLAANTIITHNYAAAIDTFVVQLITSSPSCTLTGVVVMEKPVNASIQIPVGGVTAACAPATLSFINSSTNVSKTTTFVWNFGDGSPNQTYNYTNDGQTITHTYNRGTVNCQTIVTLSAQNYCSFGSPTTAQFNPIQIYDKDQAAISPSAFVQCWPSNVFTFTNTTSRNCYAQGNNGIRYEKWDFGNYWGRGHDSIINWTAWPPTFPKTMAYPGVGNYNVILYDSNQCGVDTTTLTVSIVNRPTAGLTVNPSTVCVGTPITFTNTSSMGYSYKWNFGDNSVYTPAGYTPQSHTYASAGSYTVSVVAYIVGAPGSCKDTARIAVTVLPAPVSNFTDAPATGCNTLSTTFTDASSGGVTNWAWSFGNGQSFNGQSPPVQNYTTGVYTASLTVTSGNGCTNVSTKTLTVYQKPVPQFTNSAVCVSNSVSFTDLSTHAAGDNIINWVWNFGDGGATGNTQNTSHTYTATGTYTVGLSVATAHCSDSVKVALTVNPLPLTSFVNAPDSGCPSLPVTFTNTTSGALSYVWNFGNGQSSTSVNPTETFTNSGTITKNYSVTLVSTSLAGCKDSVKHSIKVFGVPVASFTANTSPSCAPMAVTFSNTSVGAVHYLWDFGDGTPTATTTNPIHLYQNTSGFLQSYTLTLYATNAGGCVDSVRQIIQVYPQALFNFQSLPDSGCAPLLVHFPAMPGAVLYQWNFGDGSPSTTGSNPTHTYTNTTGVVQTYTTQLIATNAFSCKDTAYQAIKIFPKPTANYTSNMPAGCTPLALTFSNTSTGITSSAWNFGDGNTSALASPAHTFTNTSFVQTDSFNVQLIVTNSFSCKDTLIKKIYVYPQVVAGFFADTPICAPVTVFFHNTSQSTASTTYTWNFGDGSPISNSVTPSHTYNNISGSILYYTASLTASNSFGCSNTYTHTYMVFPKPMPQFVLTPTVQTYPARTIALTNQTPSAGSFNNVWHYGDSTSFSGISSPNHTYATWGTYSVTLVVSSTYCKDSVTQIAVIKPPLPIAGFKGKIKGCVPLKASFVSTSQYATSYYWDFGDNLGSSTIPNPTYIYTQAGVYSVKLVVTGPGGKDSIAGIDSVTAYALPHALFTAAPTSVSMGVDPVVCSNLSTGASSYNWNFGDGSPLISVINPQHIYQQTGQFAITLYAISLHGCIDSLVYTYITVQEQTSIQVPNAFTPSAAGPSPDGVFDPTSHNNDIFHPNVSGLATYEMDIFNRWGELLFVTQDIRVGWDGYYKGKPCEQGVYVWKIVGTSINGQRMEKKGDLTLLR
ncbi:MAG: PKD domain-containing protein [Bacteroidetes bacterium]|nr:PKD domain-containing protein [Bacteroidota bacterium]